MYSEPYDEDVFWARWTVGPLRTGPLETRNSWDGLPQGVTCQVPLPPLFPPKGSDGGDRGDLTRWWVS